MSDDGWRYMYSDSPSGNSNVGSLCTPPPTMVISLVAKLDQGSVSLYTSVYVENRRTVSDC